MSAAPSLNYSFYGCRISSEIPLLFVPVHDDCTGPVDIEFVRGDVAEELPDAMRSNEFLSIGHDGTVLLRMGAIGRVLIENGSRVTIQAEPSTSAVEIESLLMGSVAGVLLHQRAVLPLHASCVALDDTAIAFVGGSGDGKSTLAAEIVRRGAVLMSDDICAVRFPDDAAPYAVSGSNGLRLWPDSREVFRSGAEDWTPIRQGHEKQVGRVGSSRNAEHFKPRRLAAVFRLKVGNVARPTVHRLHGAQAMSQLSRLVYRLHIGGAIGRKEHIFRSAMQLADQVPIFELCRPQTLGQVEELADLALGELAALT